MWYFLFNAPVKWWPCLRLCFYNATCWIMGKQQSDRPEYGNISCGGLSRSQGQSGGVVLVLVAREREGKTEREGEGEGETESICLHGDVTPRPAASSLPLRVIHRPSALSWRMNPNNSFNKSASILPKQFAKNDLVASSEEQQEDSERRRRFFERRDEVLFVFLSRFRGSKEETGGWEGGCEGFGIDPEREIMRHVQRQTAGIGALYVTARALPLF